MPDVVGLLYEGFSSAALARQGFSKVLCQILGDLAGLGVNAGIKATGCGGSFVGQVELLDSREHTTPPEAT